MIAKAHAYYTILRDSARRTVGANGITVAHVQGIQAGLDTLKAVLDGAMSIQQAVEYINDLENDQLPGIDFARRIVLRAARLNGEHP